MRGLVGGVGGSGEVGVVLKRLGLVGGASRVIGSDLGGGGQRPAVGGAVLGPTSTRWQSDGAGGKEPKTRGEGRRRRGGKEDGEGKSGGRMG